MDYRSLLYERGSHPDSRNEGYYVTITLNQPERRNCLSSELLGELEHALRSVGADGEVAGVVLAANGPVFSSGHDLAEMAQMTHAELQGLFTQCTDTMVAMSEIPQVVVARVHALATAAGAQLAASADLIVASTEAGFATPGGKGGLFCHTPMVALARPIGRKRAAELALTGDTIDAATALDWGLVNRVAPPERLDEVTMELLSRATRGSRHAKGVGKQTLYAQMDLPVGEAYKLAVDVMAAKAAAGDGAEWPKAFTEKRRPVWTHSS
ncbi:MAG: enoyl-CoA hydratase-related protein [Acidimicrobiaceae bacterium]|nr:enoyl-CoA hydratase-related protein [Acidimicrobiaceae bacterium]